MQELCKGHKPVEDDEYYNPFQGFIAKELYEHFQKSKLIIFYHHNSSHYDKEFKAFATFKKANMYYKKYGKKTMEMAIKGTPYEAVLDFYCSQNMTLFSPEPEIKKVLKISKKFPQLVIMGKSTTVVKNLTMIDWFSAAIFEHKFISKDELIKYSEIPNLQTAQASLVQTLNSAAMQLSSNLISHQQTLVGNLGERMKQLDEESK